VNAYERSSRRESPAAAAVRPMSCIAVTDALVIGILVARDRGELVGQL
jgi:hypothetical protein